MDIRYWIHVLACCPTEFFSYLLKYNIQKHYLMNIAVPVFLQTSIAANRQINKLALLIAFVLSYCKQVTLTCVVQLRHKKAIKGPLCRIEGFNLLNAPLSYPSSLSCVYWSVR